MDVLRQKARQVFDEGQAFNTRHKVTKLVFTRGQPDSDAINIASLDRSCWLPESPVCNDLLSPGMHSNVQNDGNLSPTVTGPLSLPPRDPAQSDTQVPDETGSDAGLPFFNLVVVSQAANLTMGIHRELLEGLFEEYKIEPYIFHLIVRNVDGFYSFPASFPTPEVGILSYFLHVRGWFMLAWSYEPQTSKTSAILIERPSASGRLQKEITDHSGLLGHPLALALICCRHILDRISVEIVPELATIVDVEAKTGFNPFEGGSIDTARFLGGHKPENDDLGILAGLMSNTSVVLALHKKYLGFTNGLLKQIARSQFLHATWKKIIPDGRWDEYERLSKRLVEVSSVSRAECDMTTPYITLLRERADAQQKVIVSFMAKREYKATIELAKDSRSIALASRYDSSAMKAIAFITMAFLPATFFAALFAMPLFKWEESLVVQRRFWVYLAFVLPTTATIPVVWFFVSRRQHEARAELEKTERKRVATNVASGLENRVAFDDQDERDAYSYDAVEPPSKRKSRLARALRRNW